MMPRDPWDKLGPDDARRVDGGGRYDFFWVVLEAGMPALMLKLPSFPQPAPQLPRLKNLDASFRTAGEHSVFVLGLKERSQLGIFETLCRDVVTAGEAGDDFGDALSRTIKRTQRWHYLLRGGSERGLTVEEQRGLVGELAFLRELISSLGPEAAVEAWTGPTGSAKDFELIGSCVEVKTRRAAAKPHVVISSADQLADVPDSRVFLRVVNVASSTLPEGETLHDHVKQTARLVEQSVNAVDAWEDAISAAGYDAGNDYGGRRWKLGEVATYEVGEGFPRIATPLPSGVSDVRYSISLDSCASFRLEGELVDIIRKGCSHDGPY